MTSAPTIETERFRLRSAERRDFDAYADMWADERVTRFIGGGAGRTRTESWGKFIGIAGMWPLMGFGYWVFADKADDRFIGCGGLSWFDRGMAGLEGHVEAGWAVAPALWGQGVAGEVMGAALGWADAALGREIRCIIDAGHGASERVAAKLGFAPLGAEPLGEHMINLYARPVGATRA